MLKILNTKMKFIDILDCIAAVELLRREEGKGWNFLDVYYNIIYDLGRMHKIINSDTERMLILGFFMTTVEETQKKFKKGG